MDNGPPRLAIIGKVELLPEQELHLNNRLSATEHQFDSGPSMIWHNYQTDKLYAFILKDTDLPIGIANISGPAWGADAGWWIDCQYRGKGFGRELVDLLARELRRRGFHKIGAIKIFTLRGDYDRQSGAMKKRLQSHFF